MLAARGGARLDRTLASVAWARERIALDPAARVDGRHLGSGVRHVPRPAPLAELSAAEWLLLLCEGEVAPPALEAAVAAALRGAAADAAFAVPVEMHGLATSWTPRRAPVRLAPRHGARLVARDGRAELAPPGPRVVRLDTRLVAEAPASLEDAVWTLDAESAALAAWLHAHGPPARAWELVLPPLAAVARVLLAPGRNTRAWARWVAAVLAGYATLVVPAKRWEAAQRAGIATIPVRGRAAKGGGA